MKTEPIDKNRCQEFLENVKNEGRKATFHRAFDCTRDPYEAIETLIDLGFDRLLTSGQEATAEEGIHLLADLQKKYGNQIEIIAGCGVNENNAQKIIDKTGIKQLHSTCRGWESMRLEWEREYHSRYPMKMEIGIEVFL